MQASTLSVFRNNFNRLDEIVAGQDMSDRARAWFMKAVGKKTSEL